MWKKLSDILVSVGHSTSGATLVYFALIMPVFIGFAGLGFDATLWFMEKRQLQTVADSSAMTAAYAISKNETSVVILTAATADANRNNFNIGGDNTISVVSPPVKGEFVGLANYVTVTVSHPGESLFTRILGRTPTTITNSATAGILVNGDHCILALSDTRDRALEFSGTSDVDINCGVASNSNSNEAIYLNGTASLTADPSAQAYGDIYTGNNATLLTPNPIQALSQKSEDPFKDLTVTGMPGTCDETDRDVKGAEGSVTLSPGRYCGGLSLSAGADATFSPGTYYIYNGNFTVNGNARIVGDGVTIILTGSTAENIGIVTINGGADVTLTAPTTGIYKGIVFYQDQRALYADGSNSFLGGADMSLKGAMYFPSQELKYSGGSSSDVDPGCLLLLGEKVTFSGNSYVSNNQEGCEDLGLDGAIGRTIVALVE